MSGLINLFLFSPPPPSYTVEISPPLYRIEGTPCLWYAHRHAKKTLVFFHDNATDLGLQRNIMYQMSRATKCNVCAVEYPGYGTFAGTPDYEAAIKASVRAVVYIMKEFGPVVLVGRSIGTGIATQVAKRMHDSGQPVQGLVLISAFSSVSTMVESIVGHTLAILLANGVMDTQRILERYDIPLLLIHGDEDFFIPYHHSQRLYARSISTAKYLYTLHGDTHTKLSWSTIYAQINRFLDHDVLNE